MLPDGSIEWYLPEQWHIILLGQVLTTGFAKERLDLTTGSADVGGHVLNQPQHRHFNFLEHFDAFTGVEQCNVLWRGNDHRTR